MVTNGIQRNVHDVGLVVETTDMQQLCRFTLAVCIVVAVVPSVTRCLSPGERLASAMPKSRQQGKQVTAPGCPSLVISGPVQNHVILC